MEFKGTKGDWKVIHEINVTSENHRPICACGVTDYNEKDSMVINKANAQLIASAPELLKALLLLIDPLTGLCFDSLQSEFTNAQLSQIESAIEKAIK